MSESSLWLEDFQLMGNGIVGMWPDPPFGLKAHNPIRLRAPLTQHQV